MNMKAIYKVLTAALAMTAAVGCYEKFEEPAPVNRYESDSAFEEAFAEEGLTQVDIKTVKGYFMDTFRSMSREYADGISYSGSNSGWSDTKTIKFGELTQEESDNRTGNEAILEWKEAADYYIKGRVVSDDTQGNVYKSLFIDDGTAGIEIKLTNGLFLNYPQGSWVYIKLRNLYLGNYRMMLSIGNGPTSSYNAIGTKKYYANSNIEDAKQIKECIFPGRLDDSQPLYAKEVDETNYNTLSIEDLGRLVRFKGVRCYYSQTKTQNHTVNSTPILSAGYDEAQIYPQWIDTNYAPKMPTIKPWYKWAFAIDGVSLYGSVCFTFLYDQLMSGQTVHTNDPGVYTVRSSGYSRFAGKPVPRDGAKADITAIYGVYGKSQYDNTYQLTVNNFEDMVFYDGSNAFLKESEVEALTPDGYSYNEEEGRYDYNSDDDSYFVPSKESSDRTDA